MVQLTILMIVTKMYFEYILSVILAFVEKMKKQSPFKFLRASEHTQKIKFELYSYITKFWSFLLTKHETNRPTWSGSSSREWHRFWRPSRILSKKLKNAKKCTRKITQGHYAYCKYLEIIRAGVFKWEQKQVAAADSAKTIIIHHHIVGGDLKIIVSYKHDKCWRSNT